MIAVVDVAVQAANVSMPLFPWRAFRNSYSSVRVRNVPRKIGKWNITNVTVQVTYPDGSIKTADAVLTGGVWVATLEGTATAGTSIQGYKILASGIDENGQPVSNYCLGRGVVTILEDDGELIPENVITYTRLLSAEPSTPKEGDLWPLSSGGYAIFQNGEAHSLGLTEEDLEPYAKKRITVEGHKTISLPQWFQDVDWGYTADFDSITGNVIRWTYDGEDRQFAVEYDVSTYALTYVTGDRRILFGNYSPEDIHMQADYGEYFSCYDPDTGEYFAVYASYDFADYDFPEDIVKDVVYSVDGEDGILDLIDAKQDELTQAQLSAVNSGITSEKVAAYDSAIANPVELAEETTWAQLKAKRDAGQLTPNKLYRITDFVTTVKAGYVSPLNNLSAVSMGYPFDVILRAATTSALYEEAQLAQHQGQNVYGNDELAQAQVWYDIDNNSGRFDWADTTNGKGVIYRVIDRRGNDIPYDPYNIVFQLYELSGQWAFTAGFPAATAAATGKYDTRSQVFSNVIRPFLYANNGAQKLNYIYLGYQNTYGNFFDYSCQQITINGYNHYYNIFGPNCSRIYMRGQARVNTFGKICNRIWCGSNMTGCTFDEYCSVMVLGSDSSNLKSYVQYSHFGLNAGLTIDITDTTSTSSPFRYFDVRPCINTSSNSVRTLTLSSVVGRTYTTVIKSTNETEMTV